MMQKYQTLILVVGVSLLAGFSLAALSLKESEPAATAAAAATGFDPSANVEERIKALEIAVNAERQARQLLEEEIFALYEELDAMSAAPPDDIEAVIAEELSASEVERLRLAELREASQPSAEERRRNGLIEAGFSAARADWIIQRESELRMEMMQDRYEALRAGEPMNPMMRGNAEFKLRQELGDPQYELYLTANNQPTTVGVGAVFDASPAQSAGLLPGDQITHYDGARVFSTFDLTRQTMEGDPGENVVVNISRGGVPMQVVMPRGPLGINTGRRR
jgi:hypothetical protein